LRSVRLFKKIEAIECAKEYKKRFGRFPDRYAVGEYFMLWTDAEHAHEFQSALDVCKNPDMAILYMKKNPPLFSSFEDFLKCCEE